MPDDVAELAILVGQEDPGRWWHNCHAASLQIVESGLYPNARVARGFCEGVIGQHSWVVLGTPEGLGDCYDYYSQIIDPTLWSYDRTVPGVWKGNRQAGKHTPHGAGYFFQGNPPRHWGGETVYMSPDAGLSESALQWLALAGGPWDFKGWSQLIHLPVEGWPSGEIIGALATDERFKPLIPIDILGMLTDQNPSGSYLGRGYERTTHA